MAVPKKRKSKSRKGMRRANQRVAIPAVVFCSCGEPTRPHTVCAACGVYKGRQIIQAGEQAA